MTDMINMSRLANGARSAGLMRRSMNEALFIARNRTAFGSRLVDLPLMQRQLVKILVTTEQARSMTFHTARVLQAADAGDGRMAKVLRILTPLIKFRTCRDARKVAGDAMEVRGGCGYIEDWSDARVLRDAHLGSIWEGTSNIVALDVTRAIRREGALDALRDYVQELGKSKGMDDAAQEAAAIFQRAADFLEQVAHDRAREEDTRLAATAVYNATSAIFLCWEAAQLRLKDNPLAETRATLAAAVIKHKLTPRDPLSAEPEDRAMIAALLAGAFDENAKSSPQATAE